MKYTNCPIWDDRGHNWIVIRGMWIFWRRYKICCACGYIERFLPLSPVKH